MESVPATPATADGHGELVARILRWAKAEDNVRAVVATGSWAPGAAMVDRFSDRDLELIVGDPAPLLADDGWIRAIAPVWASLYFDNGDDPDTRLVFFEDARKIDFTLADTSRLGAMATRDADTDTHYIGTKMLKWVDPVTWTEIHGMFGHFDAADSWRAIFAMADLFARLTRETAGALGIAWPVETERAIGTWLREMAPPGVLAGTTSGEAGDG